jgi:hypothetical protein
MELSGAGVDQTKGAASAKALRQEHLDMFMEHGEGQCSKSRGREGGRWKSRAVSGGRALLSLCSDPPTSIS